MQRPDEAMFIEHSKHFLDIDEELENFCLQYGFTLDKNLHRTPCRVLRKGGNPELVIDIYQDGNWRDTAYREDLPHTFAVGGYYEDSPADGYLYKLESVIAENESFDGIVTRLREYLTTGIQLLHSWTPAEFLTQGRRIENLKRKFNL